MEKKKSISAYILVLVSLLLTEPSQAAKPKVTYGHEDQSKNLIKNWDFENLLNSTGDWYSQRGDVMVDTTDAHTGKQSVRIGNITARFGGIYQKIYGVKGNTMYYLSVYVKTLSDPATAMFYYVRLWLDYKEKNATGTSHFSMARFPAVRSSSRWRQIGGDFISPDKDIEYFGFKFETSDRSVEYLLDTVALVEIPKDPLWKERANADIDKYRKNSVTITSFIPKYFAPFCQIKFKVSQTKRDFGIGTAIQSNVFGEGSDYSQRYRQFFYDHFEWAVFANSLKWKLMEKTKGKIQFNRVDKAFQFLDAKNITVRGHTILWPISIPTWVDHLTGQALLDEVNRRIDYIVGHYAGRMQAWDTINEWLHSRWYEDNTYDVDFQKNVFNRAYKIDNTTDYYVNDYQALRTGDMTSALVDQLLEMRHQGAPASGIGIQSHLRVPVPVELLRWRIKVATAAGFPVTVTELSLHSPNVSVRAEMLDQAYRIYFSQPGVNAILLWFFGNQSRASFIDDMVLFEGDYFTPNEAGLVLLDLLKEWRTNVVKTARGRQVKERFHAFHGAYHVEVFYKDQWVKNHTFYLHPGSDMEVNIPLSRDELQAVDDGDKDNCGEDGKGKENGGGPDNINNQGVGWRRKNDQQVKVNQMPPRRGVRNPSILEKFT